MAREEGACYRRHGMNGRERGGASRFFLFANCESGVEWSAVGVWGRFCVQYACQICALDMRPSMSMSVCECICVCVPLPHFPFSPLPSFLRAFHPSFFLCTLNPVGRFWLEFFHLSLHPQGPRTKKGLAPIFPVVLVVYCYDDPHHPSLSSSNPFSLCL